MSFYYYLISFCNVENFERDKLMLTISLSAKIYQNSEIVWKPWIYPWDISMCVLVCYHIAWLLLNAHFKSTYFRDRKYAWACAIFFFLLLKCIFNFLGLIHECHGKLFPVILCFVTLLYDSMRILVASARVIHLILTYLTNNFAESSWIFCANAQTVWCNYSFEIKILSSMLSFPLH